ncbi:lytic transglycosylase domain-containing protein [Sphaerisporangium sp. TRM90804]|uniref:lytic transglycosylase domain-containing protein n=1 Tax=Sphaerisporangium sp. TRM90804 TaxID=3031113 RepID=UPI00244917E3|nr:lytic transglycosylase domain-containing protein [Sphaerisporangium sp. TRM90804]MDH2428987.1 lytic transglycosylase domain-containing protein [Sphaerisporangium sp. TRM90804]
MTRFAPPGAAVRGAGARVVSLGAALAVAAAAVCGCANPAAEREPAAPAAAPPSSAATETRPAASSAPEPDALPDPDARIPQTAPKLAEALHTTTRALHDAVDAWTKDGDPAKGAPPEPVVLLALHQQRIYRYAARHPKVAARAFAALPAKLAKEARDNTAAIQELLALARPIKGSATFKVQDPPPAGALLELFRKAERRFGVEWEILAAVMFAETKFARVKSASHAGAQGPMQFMPATWKAYGLGGDIQDPRDAVMAAANYLRASGAPRDYQRALHAYNPSQAYVNAILLHARQIKRDPRNYYAYYNWQVFVLTTTGERRLTGP